MFNSLIIYAFDAFPELSLKCECGVEVCSTSVLKLIFINSFGQAAQGQIQIHVNQIIHCSSQNAFKSSQMSCFE